MICCSTSVGVLILTNCLDWRRRACGAQIPALGPCAALRRAAGRGGFTTGLPRASPRLCARISAGLRHWRLQADQPCYGMSPCSIEGWQQEHSNAHRTQSVALSPLLLDRWRDSGLAVFPGRAIFGWKICWQVLRRGAVWRYTPSRTCRCWLLTCPVGPISIPTVVRL